MQSKYSSRTYAGKLQLLDRIMTGLQRQGGHQVLIFSQVPACK